jgi:N-glycosylase/DNA lyase
VRKKAQPEPLTAEALRTLHRGRAPLIRKRLEEFSRVDPSRYFYELAYCLLTPQSSAAHALKCVALLEEQDFFNRGADPEPLLRTKANYIRFHRTKAQRLEELRARFGEIRQVLAQRPPDAETLRAWLVTNVKGLGWKEASHFLRNIGVRNLAILDRHILKNLVRARVLRSVPKSLSPSAYKRIEKKFHTFARKIDIPVDELDLLFWSMETGELLK